MSVKRRVSDAELGVLKVLWDRGALVIRQIAEQLYPDGGPSAHATVQKLLERLGEKDCVRRTREGRSHIYTATVGRADLIDVHLEDTADRFCEGAFAPLLTRLVTSSRLSPAELDQLRALVQEFDEQGSEGE